MRDEKAAGETGCYVSVDSNGEVVSLCVDEPEHKKDVARFVADAIEEGCSIQRCKVRDVWDGRVKLFEKFPEGVSEK